MALYRKQKTYFRPVDKVRFVIIAKRLIRGSADNCPKELMPFLEFAGAVSALLIVRNNNVKLGALL